MLRDLTPRVERAVRENLATPCIRNQRTLLVCAVAHRVRGDAAESERLEEHAEALGMEGYDRVLGAPRLRLALLKNDVDALERLIDTIELFPARKHAYWFELPALAAQLDALLVLGEGTRVEEAAEPLLELKDTYIEAFALRALGRVRGERSLIEQALARFEEMHLDWHAEQTRDVLTT